jgi:hypothetical protein
MQGYYASSGAGDVVGKRRWSSGRPFEKAARLLAESPVKKAFVSTIQADLSCILLRGGLRNPQINTPLLAAGMIYLKRNLRTGCVEQEGFRHLPGYRSQSLKTAAVHGRYNFLIGYWS